MFFDRYWYHTRAFQEFIKRVFSFLRSHLVQTIETSDVQDFEISKTDIVRKWFRILSWITWSILVSPKINSIAFGRHGHVYQVRKSWTRKVFRFFSKMYRKRYESKMKQKSYTELLGESFNHIYNKNGLPEPPPRPQMRMLSPIFPDFQ